MSSMSDKATGNKLNKTNIRTLLLLHVLLGVYSLCNVFSKLAAGESFLSFRFCLFYGLVIFLLMIYAFFWQQVIKRLPLILAYANKAVTVVWGMIWGCILFNEGITVKKVIGALTVIIGIVLFAKENPDEQH